MRMNSDQKQPLGYFIKRADISVCKLDVFFKELQIYVFELEIIKAAIAAALKQDFSAIDCGAGDWKCQTRAAMIIDLIENNPCLPEQLSQELSLLDNLIDQHFLFFKKSFYGSYEDKRAIEQELHNISLQEYFKKNNLIYDPSQNVIFLSLCFFLTPKNIEPSFVAEYEISKNKLKFLQNTAKKNLCLMSINYEQSLALQHGTIEEQKSLTQIEHKAIQSMTSLYCGFNAIFKKIKQSKQPFLTKTVLFCQCGGIIKILLKKYSVINNDFSEISFDANSNEPILVLEGYNYQGSLDSLKNILNVPQDDIYIFEHHYKLCTCSDTTKEIVVEKIEETIMAFFAQHPQFTNGSNINFEQLNLIDSELHKKYTYLQSLPGVSMNDMSNFFIDHVYASTIQNVFKSLQGFKK